MLQNSMLGDLKDKNSLEKLLKGRLPSPDIKQVLIPVHLSNCHWALARIHFPTKSFQFDDSLKWLPPGDLIARLRHLIELLSELLPDNVHLTSRSWKRGTLRLERFGMPVQSSVAGTEGSASCGIAVVLAARDFCQFGLPNQVANDIPKFKWSPNEAWYHRFLCLLDIINRNLKCYG